MKEKENEKVIPMTFDPVFKTVLTSNKDYLVDIISGITKLDKNYVKENIVFKNQELAKANIKERGKITDLIVDIKRNIINLEMNNNYYKALIEKNDNYMNKILLEEIDNDMMEKNYDFKRIIQINFDNYEVFDEREIIKFEMIDKERGIVRNKHLGIKDKEIYHINLKRIKEKYYNKGRLNKLEKELLLMVLESIKELEEVSKGSDTMEKVRKKISSLSMEEQLKGIYIKEEQDAWLAERRLEEAKADAIKEGLKEGLEQGHKEGLEEGRKEGIQQGIEQGREEGINEGIKTTNINNSKKMLENNIDKEIISKVTGLNINEINNL